MSKRYKKSEELLYKALHSIPLGSQTFSKSKTQLPYGISPYFVDHAKGSRIWDVDNNEYIDFVNALASVTLGYCDPEVDAAVLKQMQRGVTFSLPHKLEMEVAELLIELIPCAEMVRFGKNGTDATSAAIRLARAYTQREHVLVCGYHGWQDWYVGSTSRDLGVPNAVKRLTHTFIYNDMESLEKLFYQYKNNIAAVILEPMNVAWPENDFLNKAKNLTRDNGAVFIFDETITGCRFAKGGAQELFNVTPDLTALGKGLGNGFPLSAIVGKKEVMKKMEDIFFSGTFGGETLSLAAAKTVLTKVKEGRVIEKLHATGKDILDGMQELIIRYDLSSVIKISGHPSWSILTISNSDQNNSWEIKTLLMQELFKRGIFCIGTHNISCAHNEYDVRLLLTAYDEVFSIFKTVSKENALLNILDAEPLKPLFKIR